MSRFLKQKKKRRKFHIKMSKRRQQKMNVFKISFDVTLMVGEVYPDAQINTTIPTRTLYTLFSS